MSIRKITIALVASIALIGCAPSTPSLSPQEVAEERWSAVTSEERADICDSFTLFGEDWVRELFESVGDNSEYNAEEIDAIVDEIVDNCTMIKK